LQVDIRDIQVFQNTLKSLNILQSKIKDKIYFIFTQLQKKQDEVIRELTTSNTFLNIAKANEIHKQAILVQKQAELARALQQEASALASGNPIAIAADTEYVAKKANEEKVAKIEYQEAKDNRINMEKRVELVKSAKNKIDILYEQVKKQLNNAQIKINSLTEIISIRITKGDLLQKDYLSQNSKSNSEVEKYKNIPQIGGVWTGEPGNSMWKPDRNIIPKQPYGNKKSWGRNT